MWWKKKLNKLRSFSKSLSSHFLRLFYLSYFKHFFNILICILILWTLYGFVIYYGWWTGDDPGILYSTVKNGIFKHFYCPQVWKFLSSTNLTPWINLSFGVDWHLFGFHAKGFYIHQLISFSLVLIFCYLVIIEFLPPLVTFIVLLLFITSRPAVCFAEFLWVRHYLEGLGLAAMAFWLFIKSTKRKSTWITVLGAIFYGLAMSAKEIYTPLVILLFFFPLKFSNYNRQKQFDSRCKFLMPYIVIAIAYIIWRIYMLGLSNVIASDIPINNTKHFSFGYFFKNFLLGFTHSMGWSPIETAVIVIIMIGGGILYIHNDLKKLFFLFLWIVLITAPILPVLTFLKGNSIPLSILRILIVETISFYIFLGVILKRLLSLPKGLWVVGCIFLFFIGINLHILITTNTYQEAINTYTVHKTSGKFMLLPKIDAVLVKPPSSSWFYYFLKKLAVITHQIPTEESTPKICADMCLCSQIMKNKKVSWWQYINGQVVPIKKFENCVVQNNKPLWVKLIYKKSIIKWEFGPYKKGTYFFLGAQWNLPGEIYSLPPKGIYHLFLQRSLDFWIRYDSPEGWRIYSPLLHLEPINNHAKIYYRLKKQTSSSK